MSKRFTDIDIWDKPWFMALTPEERNFWFYLTNRCDNVGVWTPNYISATLYIGGEIDWQGFINKVNGNIEILKNGKWWLIDFCRFQYNKLNENCKPHKSYLALLERHGLLERVKGIHTVQEKEKDKDKELEKEKEKDKRKYADGVYLSESEYGKLVDKYGQVQTRRLIEKLSNAKGAKGYKYKCDYKAILTWVVDAVKAMPLKPEKAKVEHRCFKCKGLLVDLGGGEYGCPPCSKTFKMNDGKLKDTS